MIKTPKPPVEEYMMRHNHQYSSCLWKAWKHGNRGHIISVKIGCTDCLNPISKTKVETRSCFLRDM